MTPIIPKPQFETKDGYYCNQCSEYKDCDQFYESWIHKKQRQCKSCALQAKKATANLVDERQGDKIEHLLLKLKRRLRYYGHSQIASGLTRETVMSIIEYNNVQDIEHVEKIISPQTLNDCLDICNYHCKIHKVKSNYHFRK